MNQSTAQFWNIREANKFDQITKESGRIPAIQRMVEFAKPHISPKDRITIDLGCGTGLFSELSNNQNIIGVDFSSPFLALAAERMTNTQHKSVFDFETPNNSVNNIISLFVIDDYPNTKKKSFFNKIFSFLKPNGYFFFASYSPNDERMGKLKTSINKKLDIDFKIFPESITYYQNTFQECGFEVEKTETINTIGTYVLNGETIKLTREFDLIVARKNKS